jgi:selenocysteine lyase/cysteine desulfurase
MSASLDIAAIRREFPITQRMLYFDSAHQAPLSVSVKAALERFYAEGWRRQDRSRAGWRGPRMCGSDSPG